MRLQDEIKDFKDEALADLPPEILSIMAQAIENLAESGIVNRALAQGDMMPPFALANVHGQIVSSADLLDKGPLVINFYRGSW